MAVVLTEAMAIVITMAVAMVSVTIMAVAKAKKIGIAADGMALLGLISDTDIHRQERGVLQEPRWIKGNRIPPQGLHGRGNCVYEVVQSLFRPSCERAY